MFPTRQSSRHNLEQRPKNSQSRLRLIPASKKTTLNLKIKFCDLRGNTMSRKSTEQACFDLINRGKHSRAQFVCIEDFYIGQYYVAFRTFPPAIPPFGQHESICPLYINEPDGKLSQKNIFDVFWDAYDSLKQPKLYELPIPVKTTYQDDSRNLFEARCDLVFYPNEHLKTPHGNHSDKVVEVKNLKLRKVAPATAPVDWLS